MRAGRGSRASLGARGEALPPSGPESVPPNGRGDYADPVQAFNIFVRKELYKVVEQKVVGGKPHHLRYRRGA